MFNHQVEIFAHQRSMYGVSVGKEETLLHTPRTMTPALIWTCIFTHPELPHSVNRRDALKCALAFRWDQCFVGWAEGVNHKEDHGVMDIQCTSTTVSPGNLAAWETDMCLGFGSDHAVGSESLLYIATLPTPCCIRASQHRLQL